MKSRTFRRTLSRGVRSALCFLLCFPAVANPVWVYAATLGDDPNFSAPSSIAPSPAALEAAEILGVGPQVRQVANLRGQIAQGGGEPTRRQLLMHMSTILRRILLGYLQVRQTTDDLNVSLGHTYDALDKGSRRRDRLVQLCNIANFTQFAVQSTTKAYLSIRDKPLASHIMTCTVAGCSVVVSAVTLAASTTGRSRERVPPSALADIFDLNPPQDARLPRMIERFINSPALDSTKTRKQEAIASWTKKFGLPADNKKKLQYLAAYPQKKGFGESLGLLNSRLVLLYALNALIEEFDSELLALVRFLETVPTGPVSMSAADTAQCLAQLPPGAAQAASLLDMQPQVAELLVLRGKNGEQVFDTRQLELEILLLEKVLGGALEVRRVVDRIDQEKHHQFDVVLGQLLSRRDRTLMLNDVANFTQAGILKGIAGRLLLIDQSNAANDLLNIISGVGIGLAGLATYQSRGGKRRIECDPNILGPVLNLNPPPQYRLSPLITRYLDTTPAGAKSGTTRREELSGRWKQNGWLVAASAEKRMNKLADMPAVRGKKVDTIGLVSRRLRMLFETRAMVEGFDSDLLELLCALPEERTGSATGSASSDTVTSIADATESGASREAATLLKVQPQVDQLMRRKGAIGLRGEAQVPTDEQLQAQLVLARRVLGGALQVRKMADVIDGEMAREYTAEEQMVAQTNRGIELNNSANFLQNGVLGLIGGGIAYAGHGTQADYLAIVSGGLTLGLSTLALAQQRVAWRHAKPAPNLLAQMMKPDAPSNDVRFSPLIWSYLNRTAPGSTTGQTRREQLIEHWRKSHVLTINVSNPKNIDKLAASKPTRNPLSETTKLVNNRIKMLHDIHTEIESLDGGLVDLLHTVD